MFWFFTIKVYQKHKFPWLLLSQSSRWPTVSAQRWYLKNYDTIKNETVFFFFSFKKIFFYEFEKIIKILYFLLRNTNSRDN